MTNLCGLMTRQVRPEGSNLRSSSTALLTLRTTSEATTDLLTKGETGLDSFFALQGQHSSDGGMGQPGSQGRMNSHTHLAGVLDAARVVPLDLLVVTETGNVVGCTRALSH